MAMHVSVRCLAFFDTWIDLLLLRLPTFVH